MIWFTLILISVFVVAIGEIAQKMSVSTKEDISAQTINFYVATTQLVLSSLYIFVFVQDVDTTLSINAFPLLILGSILSFFFFTFLYTSYKGNSASISQVIYSFSVFVSTFFGIIFFNESLTAAKIFGVSLIVLAVVMAQYTKGEKISKYNVYALIAALIYGLLTNIDKAFSINMDPHYYQVLGTFGFIVVSLLFSGKKIFKETKKITKTTVKTILISAIAFTIFNKLTFLAYANGGEVGRIDAINNTSLFLIIIFEVLILKDRTSLRKKIIGSILSVTGVLILGFL